MIAAYVCANGMLLAYPSVDSAIDSALVLASLEPRPRVGVGADPSDARYAAARALPGMVVCPRCEPFRAVDCCPLTASTALVRSRVNSATGTPRCVRTAVRS
jgi:hypothetical protein